MTNFNNGNKRTVSAEDINQLNAFIAERIAEQELTKINQENQTKKEMETMTENTNMNIGENNFPMEFADSELETLWNELAQIELNEEKLNSEWFIFPEGTHISEIHEWFDSEYSEGLDALNGKSDKPQSSKIRKDGNVMENIYKAKASATRAMKKAISKGVLVEGTVEVRKVDDGFQIVSTVVEHPVAKAAAMAKELPEPQKAALKALFEAPPLANLTDGERADVWFAFSEIYNSGHVSELPKRSMGGIMRGLIGRGLVNFVKNGKEYIGKRSIAVSLTSAGLAALQA